MPINKAARSDAEKISIFRAKQETFKQNMIIKSAKFWSFLL